MTRLIVAFLRLRHELRMRRRPCGPGSAWLEARAAYLRANGRP